MQLESLSFELSLIFIWKIASVKCFLYCISTSSCDSAFRTYSSILFLMIGCNWLLNKLIVLWWLSQFYCSICARQILYWSVLVKGASITVSTECKLHKHQNIKHLITTKHLVGNEKCWGECGNINNVLEKKSVSIFFILWKICA